MKYNKNSRWNVSEVAKKLGISFEELKAEFIECGIKVRADDTFDAETIQYVLSGMYGHEFDRGNHLHLETGDVAWEIQRGKMKWNEGYEFGAIHELTLWGWAQKLWLDEAVLLNEMRSQGHSIDIDDTVSPEVIRYAIDSAEVYWSWESLSSESQEETYLPNSEYYISEMALQMWVPATALMSWLAYNGYNTDYMTHESKSAFDIAHKNWDIDRGRSYNAWVICDECDTGCEHIAHGSKHSEHRSHYDIKEWVVASADPVEVEGIVASSDTTYAGGTKTQAIARGLLWFLAIPLLFGIFSKNDWGVNSELVATGPAEISLHGVWEDNKTIQNGIEEVVVQDNIIEVLVKDDHEEVVVQNKVNVIDQWNENDEIEAILDDQQAEAAEPMQVQEFINNLVEDINTGLGGEEHAAAMSATLPTSLPATWTK